MGLWDCPAQWRKASHEKEHLSREGKEEPWKGPEERGGVCPRRLEQVHLVQKEDPQVGKREAGDPSGMWSCRL